MKVCRGVRGAVPVVSNTETDILAATDKLLGELINRNGILADVAPTVLEILGIKKPIEMTGKSLIVKWEIIF